MHSGSLAGVYEGCVDWGDYDNDRDLDILLTGSGVSKIYRNTGSGFIEVYAGSLTGVWASSSKWGDFDNDGDLDIVIAGYVNLNNLITKIYRNIGSGFVEAFAGSIAGIYNGEIAWGDYDNDGDLDIVLVGNSSSTATIPVSKIYQNTGSGFTEVFSGNLEGVYQSSLAWGDYDNDGDLDILLSGLKQNGSKVTKIYRNNNLVANNLPSAPLNLTSSVNGSDVEFNWDKSTDNQTPQNGLKYNLVIGTSPGVVNTLSPMSDRATGYRRVINLGNTNHNNSWTIKGLKPGTYYWSVQTVDNCFAGSLFAGEKSFIVGGVKIIPEGLYNAGTNRLNKRDTLTAYLRSINSPYVIIDSSTAVIDSITFVCNFNFLNVVNGAYYLVIKHRNSIETWSKDGGEIFTEGIPVNYDFTSSEGQAYGNNMVQKSGKWCIYSGDVNQDGVVDVTDLVITDTDNLTFVTGNTVTDINGDGLVDVTDLIYIDINNINFVGSVKPQITGNGTCPGIPTVTYSGKIYNTIQIGTQCWFKENLDIGTMITGSQNPSNNGVIEKYCYNDNSIYCNNYGGLYQWNEAMRYSINLQGICPPNWHIPTYTELQTLIAAANSDGNSLKALGQGSGVGAGTNTSGFSGLLAGYRYPAGSFDDISFQANFWSSTAFNSSTAYDMYLYYNTSNINLIANNKQYSFSVRCIKD